MSGGLLLELISVCRRPPRWVVQATTDYARRCAHHHALRFRYVAPGADSASVQVRRRDEAQRLAKVITPDTHLVVLAIDGTALSSPALADWLAGWRAEQRTVALVIGGADGLDPAFLARARQRWSLSALTLPHLLVQIIVAEQLYRASTILAGHPYHRA